MLKKLTVAAFLSLTALCAVGHAQTIEEIAAKHVEARGGIEKWRALKTLKTVSRSDAFSFNEYWQRPNLVRSEVLIPYPEGTDIRAFDGKNGWRINPAEGSTEPRSMSAAESEDLTDRADSFMELIYYKEKGHKFELLGRETVDSVDCFKLKLTRKDGEVSTVYIDSQRYLEIKRVKTAREPQGGNQVEIVTQIGDYKSVEGLLLPHRVARSIREYEVNKPMPKALFSFPSEKEETEASTQQESQKAIDVSDPKVRAQLLNDHPESDVNKDGMLNLEEAWAFVKRQNAQEKLLEVGQIAPEWELADAKGRKHKLSDYRGQIVVMDFWAVWCIPCHKAMPSLQKLHDKYSKQGLVVLGVSTWEKGGDPARLMRDRHYNYGLVLHGETIVKDYHIAGLPTIYVIGRDGRLIYSGFGANAIAEQRRDDLIEKALKPPEKP